MQTVSRVSFVKNQAMSPLSASFDPRRGYFGILDSSNFSFAQTFV